MATAKRPGGLYYIGENAVDSEGKTITDAPPRSANTDPSKQPGALNAPSMEEKIAASVAKAIKASDKKDESKDDEDGESTKGKKAKK